MRVGSRLLNASTQAAVAAATLAAGPAAGFEAAEATGTAGAEAGAGSGARGAGSYTSGRAARSRVWRIRAAAAFASTGWMFTHSGREERTKYAAAFALQTESMPLHS